MRIMKHAKKILNAIQNGLLMVVGIKANKSAVAAGLLDFSGQGRNKYGY